MTFARKLTHLLAGLMLLSLGFAHAAEIKHTPDVQQALNFKKDVGKGVGYLSTLTIGGRALAADLRVVHPDGTTSNVVGAISSVSWAAGHGDPIMFVAQVSTANRQVIASMLQQQLRDNSVTLQFVVFEFDTQGKKWYPAFGSPSGTTLSGLILMEDKKLKLAVAPQPGEVKSPQNWGLTLGVAPAPKGQNLLVATSPTSGPVVKPWGITVGK